jgi:acetyl-CoA C-acetyltransferase
MQFLCLNRSVVMGYQSIRCGDASIVVAGGQESMSQSVHAMHMRNGIKFGNGELKDTMIVDALTDAFSNIHMGITGNLSIFVRPLQNLPQ